jgi:hypothetical protein
MMGSALCTTECGKQYKYCPRQEQQSLKTSITNMIMVEHQNSNKDHCQLTNHDDKMWLVHKSQKERGDCKEKVDGTIELAWCNKVEYET